MTSASPARGRVLAAAGAVLAGLFVILLLPTGDVPSTVVQAVSRSLRHEGAPIWLSAPSLWERLLNVALFVPVGAVLALLVPRWPVVGVTLLGFAGSLAFEAVQANLLPGRDGSWWDVATNTAGTLLGAAVVSLTRLRSGRGASQT